MTREFVRLDQASAFEVATVASLAVVALLGTIIAYQAYRGYRRNDARSMLYLAVGLCLLTVAPFALNVGLNTFADVDRVVTVFFENVSRVLGLLVVMYSLYGRH